MREINILEAKITRMETLFGNRPVNARNTLADIKIRLLNNLDLINYIGFILLLRLIRSKLFVLIFTIFLLYLYAMERVSFEVQNRLSLRCFGQSRSTYNLFIYCIYLFYQIYAIYIQNYTI